MPAASSSLITDDVCCMFCFRMEGYLTKKGIAKGALSSDPWTRRYFVLKVRKPQKLQYSFALSCLITNTAHCRDQTYITMHQEK